MTRTREAMIATGAAIAAGTPAGALIATATSVAPFGVGVGLIIGTLAAVATAVHRATLRPAPGAGSH